MDIMKQKVALLWDSRKSLFYGAIIEPNPYPRSPALRWENPVIVQRLTGTESNAGGVAQHRAITEAKRLGLPYLEYASEEHTMIVYTKSEPYGFTLENEACEFLAALLKRKVPRQEAEERAITFQRAKDAERCKTLHHL